MYRARFPTPVCRLSFNRCRFGDKYKVLRSSQSRSVSYFTVPPRAHPSTGSQSGSATPGLTQVPSTRSEALILGIPSLTSRSYFRHFYYVRSRRDRHRNYGRRLRKSKRADPSVTEAAREPGSDAHEGSEKRGLCHTESGLFPQMNATPVYRGF